ncbi:DUF1622 domain-containing protein [Flavisolibacter ginsengisoli]|jgi:uncharacterized membrane protein|uniref:DUF1622 domain-containing protein n=1 Tax=Flavisolibacter ginsengisoli DSM 18119 TaxID=1121884 RepID=A0A1M4SFT9_9BACT|nr:DUF1622 domain-containing protein [Flavisolibacter ginsengisoli]SHE31070.1 Protein of unknown function [Flavisolibacter ginsengisoli DSM 18119]
MKEIAEIVTKHLSSTVEVLAAFVIGVALLKFLYKYLRHLFTPNDGITNQTIRIHFGSALTVALELLLAADILATAIAPTWDDIGKLASIAVLRTALNYFLERELKNNEPNETRIDSGKELEQS